jgi:hypothetical protein
MLFFCRLSRGDKGNLFILKMFDPTYRIPLWSTKQMLVPILNYVMLKQYNKKTLKLLKNA